MRGIVPVSSGGEPPEFLQDVIQLPVPSLRLGMELLPGGGLMTLFKKEDTQSKDVAQFYMVMTPVRLDLKVSQ